MHLHEDGMAWYALHVRRRFEKVVAGTLRSKGFDAFLPSYGRSHRSSERIRQIELPLFPGYVFCRFNFSNRFQILTTPGVNALVGFGKRITPIPESELQAVRALVKSGRPCEPVPFISAGYRVRVEYGPLAGAEGFATVAKSSLRLVVSVTILQRSAAVEVTPECLKALPELADAQTVGAAHHRKREMLVS